MRRDSVVRATPDQVWSLVSDPARLAQWWPGVTRVEEASPEAWTTVLSSPQGRMVRADFSRVEADEPSRLVWRQEVEESPFERLLQSAVTTLELSPAEEGTRVAIALDQRPRGWARFSPLQFRAAGKRQVEGALEGLHERLDGEG